MFYCFQKKIIAEKNIAKIAAIIFQCSPKSARAINKSVYCGRPPRP